MRVAVAEHSAKRQLRRPASESRSSATPYEPKAGSTCQRFVPYRQLPAVTEGGSRRGRAALSTAVQELAAGARRVGDGGPWVERYLDGRAPADSAWCAGFVSWCFSQQPGDMPFAYTVRARAILEECSRKGWTHPPRGGYEPKPGDIVVWWRVSRAAWQGHVGLVHHLSDGRLYTIEGNKRGRVRAVCYDFRRMRRLLGFAHIADP